MSQNQNLPEYCTVDETAAYFRVTPWTIRQGIKKGLIPARRIGSKLIFVPRSYLQPDQVNTVALTQPLPQPPASVTQHRLHPSKRKRLVEQIAKEVLDETLDRVRRIRLGEVEPPEAQEVVR